MTTEAEKLKKAMEFIEKLNKAIEENYGKVALEDAKLPRVYEKDDGIRVVEDDAHLKD